MSLDSRDDAAGAFHLFFLLLYCPVAPFCFMLTSPKCWLLARVFSTSVHVNRTEGNTQWCAKAEE